MTLQPFHCANPLCKNSALVKEKFCYDCLGKTYPSIQGQTQSVGVKAVEVPMSKKYPQYYKPVGSLTEIDVYAVHKLFDIQDPSGAIQHASKKLLLSGSRNGGKSALKDITEARDTLTRWIQLNQ